MDKKVLRKEMFKKRANLSHEDIIEKSNTIQNKLFSLERYRKSDFIFSFVSFKDEVDTHDIIKKSLSLGKRVGVPITIPKGRQLIVSEIMDFDKELEMGYYNILSPKNEYIRETSPKLVDIVLVPGLAFSPEGYRVGYGGGYYDRFFSINREMFKIGICFEIQITPQVPKGMYDIPVDCIITEERIINCSGE
ncbi:5-formyltetrahydrofolate cyclo-ligase [Clostridium sp. Cult2]|uniref:5-formyltetrahydrofolate cyclo-ligase n=1 Tax=Clostridium sp. Cult2 TaxID=2079003 RepID=UPI001F002BA0|nr:5-formyltetrahydrofolate cyclo-ligase [Clostridium sp. Cult2]MCF6465464.1 5-formyltetrahydrofolate cyclo-ligase [Clostridium sp. Cult2]